MCRLTGSLRNTVTLLGSSVIRGGIWGPPARPAAITTPPKEKKKNYVFRTQKKGCAILLLYLSPEQNSITPQFIRTKQRLTLGV